MAQRRTDNGGPAFPRPNTEDINGYGDAGADGMSLRDYFAAAALTAAYHAAVRDNDTFAEHDWQKGDASRTAIAREAYLLADAMLEARNG